MHFHCTAGLRHMCIHGVGCVWGWGWGWSSNVHPASLRRCTKGWWSIRMNVESKVDSCSSLLEIIILCCTVTQTHTGTNTHTLKQTDCSFHSKSPRVVRVTAYVTGLNGQNKNKPRYHWRKKQTNSLKRLSLTLNFHFQLGFLAMEKYTMPILQKQV